MLWTPIITPIRRQWPAIPWCTIDKIPTKVGKVGGLLGPTRLMGGTLGPLAGAFMGALEVVFLIVFLSTDMSRPKLRLIFFYTTRLSRYTGCHRFSFGQKNWIHEKLLKGYILIFVAKLTLFNQKMKQIFHFVHVTSVTNQFGNCLAWGHVLIKWKI